MKHYILQTLFQRKSCPRWIATSVIVLTMLFSTNLSAQITQRGTATTGTSTSATVTVNRPTGVVAGDIMIANIGNYCSGCTQTSASLSGWTLIAGTDIERGRGTLLYKIATGSEPTSYTFAVTNSSTFAVGGIVAFSGVNNSTPFDVTPSSSWTTATNASVSNIPSVTTLSTNTAVLLFGAAARLTSTTNANFSNSNWTMTSPATLTELFDVGNNASNSACIGAAWATKPLTGATGAGRVNCTVNTNPRLMAGIALVLEPACETVTSASSSPTLCANSALTNITHTTTRATGIGTATGLPTGVTPSWASNTITISGTPTVAGTYDYSIPLTGGVCGGITATGRIVVSASPIVTAAANTTTFCGSGTVNFTGTTDIAAGTTVVGNQDFENSSTYTASGGSTKTGTSGSGDRPASASFVGSPTTSYWVNNGTATVTTQNFTGLQNGAAKTVAMRLASFSVGSTTNGAESTDNVWVDISLDGGSTYSREIEVNGGASGSTHWGFSTGTGVASVTYDGNNTATIFAPTGSGARTTDGFSLLQIALPTSATQVRVRVRLFNNSGSEAWIIDDITVSQAIVPTYSWTSNPAGFTSALQNPTGVTVSASTTYTLTATNPATGCSGSDDVAITVTPNNTVSAGSSTPTLCVNTALTNITHTTTGATGIGTATGLPTGVTPTWASNTITISGTPTASGTFNYTIPLTGGCGTVNATGTITVIEGAMTAGAPSSTPTLCQNTALTNITHTTTGATGIGTATGLPTGVNPTWASNTITISGTPTASGTFNYTIPLTGGCSSVNATGTITVTAPTSAGTLSGTQELCANGTTTLSSSVSGGTWSSDDTAVATIDSTTGVVTGVSAGNATMTYTVTGTGGCANATATRVVTVNSIPTTTDVTICAGGSGSFTVTSSCADITGQSSGPRNAGTGANLTGVGTTAWTNPGNITAVGTPFATVAPAQQGTSNYLLATNYGFSIPANAIINGIQLTIARSSTQSLGTGNRDNQVRLVKNNVLEATNKSVGGVYPTGMTNQSYGNATDLWGSTWTAADINNAGFGAVLSVFNTRSLGAATATVDFMQITVTYTIPGSLQWYTASSGGTAIGSGSTFNPVGVANSGLANTNTAGTTSYYVACSTAVGSCRAQADFTINPTPTVTTSGNVSICAGSSATITVSGATSYVWDNSLGTASSVTVSPSTTTTYNVTGTAENGCTNTASTTVTVNPIQTALVSIEASETTICSGTSVTFTATPTNGGTTPVYQWKVNGSNVGTNSPTFTSSTFANGNVVSCVMTSNAPVCLSGSPATSNTVTMTVNPNIPASVSVGASATTICSGTSVTFTATPTNGGTTPSYQWKLNGSNVGTNSATYTSTTLANGNTVSVVMTSSASPCLTGSPATSNSISMIVSPTTVGGIITGGGIGACQGVTPPDLTLTEQTGSVLRWEKSTDISFSNPITIVNSAAVLSGSTIGLLDVTTYFRAVVQSGVCAVAYSDVTAFTVASTTWNGSQWSNGVPDASTSALITGNFTATTDLYACNLTVSNNASVMIPQGYDVILSGALTVGTGSTFTLEHDSNLTQTASASAAVNTGKIIVKEVTPTLQRQDYAMFSSPVIGQKLQAFSPNTLSNRFYTYNPSSNVYSLVASPSATDFATGKGYLIRTPNNHPATPTVWTANYEGTPFNGNLSLPVTIGTYNAIGNPYPSAIDADMFFDANGLAEALYFYRKTNGTNSTAYATYTKSGGVSSSVRNGGNSNGNSNGNSANSLAPNGLIAVGQGFIVKAASSSISFTNAMRVHAEDAVQLRRNVERHRVWLSMTNTSGFFSQTLVAYMTGATNGVDAAIDGRFFNDSQTAFTSVINGQEYAIQGRQLPFASSDVVSLGFKTELPGTYSINLDAVDGIFLSSEVIYLKDKLTNTYTNMRNGSYTFSSLAGVFNDRFELRFAVPPTFYQDADGDGYGSAFSTIEADTAPVGYVANSSDCDDALATVNVNATEVLGNGIDDNCDGITDEATYPASGLISTSCGVTLTNLSNTLYAHNLTTYTAQNGPIQGYRFEVSEGQNTRTYDSSVSNFNLLNLPGGATYATTYSVRVSVKLAGYWRPYGTTCSVTTPAVPNSTSIVHPSCGSVMSSFWDSVFCNRVAGATGYRFRVRNGATVVGSYDSTINRFSFTNIGISNFEFGVTYSIDVLLKFGNTWRPDSEYGSVCTLTSPAAPPSSRIVSPLCGSTIASYWTTIYAQQITGAQGYRFEVSTGGQSYTFDSAVSRFNLRNVVGLPLTVNTTYSIRVSVLYNAVYYDYGSECSVTTAAVVSRIADATSAENANESTERQLGSEPVFVPVAYPNPFVDTFRIAMPEERGDIIHLLIYDLAGKLIAKEDVFAADMESSQFGSRLQSGDYLLVISQGSSIKSMHINKR